MPEILHGVGITKRDPFLVLKSYIESQVPALKGNVLIERINVDQASPDQQQQWPSLTILPGKFTPSWQQPRKLGRDANGALVHYHPPDENGNPDPTVIIVSRGTWEGMVTLRIGATSAPQRAELEQCVKQIWVDAQAVLSLQVPECGDANHSWFMGEDDFVDGAAFDGALFSQITLEATHPILSRITGIEKITQLTFEFSSGPIVRDANGNFDFGTIDPTTIEQVVVNADGTLSPAP